MPSIRITIVLFLLLFSTAAIAQKTNRSAIKINLGSLVVKNFAFQGESAIGKKTSLALGIRFQPNGTLPFINRLKNEINDPDINVENIKMGNMAITPEFRYYFGKHALKGFYMAPYARYANFKMTVPVNFTSNSTRRTANFEGSISSFSGGLMLGSQFNLGKRLILDLWILGGHGGSSNGKLTVALPLTQQEQDDIRQTLAGTDAPMFKFTYDVNSSGASISSKGAWAGIRSLALNLGFRF